MQGPPAPPCMSPGILPGLWGEVPRGGGVGGGRDGVGGGYSAGACRVCGEELARRAGVGAETWRVRVARVTANLLREPLGARRDGLLCLVKRMNRVM